MNKKGITLPIIVVIIISIGLLFTGLYSFFSTIKEISKEEKYNNQINLILDSARIWVKQNNITGDIKISLCELESNDFVGQLINPLTNQPIPNDSIIKVENQNYYFELGQHNLKFCSKDNIYTYVELDANDTKSIDIPIENENIKKITIKENENEVYRMYRNKKTTYEILYLLDNNEIKTKYIIIKDTTPPTIELDLTNYDYDKTTETITIKKYSNFKSPKPTITDNSTSNIINSVENNVDTFKVGNYELIYKAIDEDENETIKKINVIVKSDNENENYYIDTDKYTNKKEIKLKLKGLNTTKICISNSSICEKWNDYQENIDWTVYKNQERIYVYYKTIDNDVHLETIDIYLDTQKPSYVSSKKVLLGPSYNLSDIITAQDDLSGIKGIYTQSNKTFKPNSLGENNLQIEIIDNAGNKTNENITITTYKNLKCDNSISSIPNEDGLVKDNNKCIFIGKNPNNYIKLKNDLYRIISIEENNKIKIIKEESLTKETFTGNWQTSNIKQNLINYYNKIDNNILESGTFYFGNINQGIVNDIYQNNYTKNENSNIGLLSINEYLKAGTCPVNTNWDKLLNNNPCKQNNWLYNNMEYWLINTTQNKPIYITKEGNISYTYEGNKKEVRPVLYLKSNLGIIKGNGKQDNPYIIDETIEPTKLTCSIETSNEYELTKTLTVNSPFNTVISFDGINWSNNRKKEVNNSGIITAYVKTDNEITSCSIRLYEEYEYRYKECSNNNKIYGAWHTKGSSKESIDFIETSKKSAENSYLNHYEVVDNTPCNNCKWVTKYERTAESCKSFDNSSWSNWQTTKPEENKFILIDKPRIKYGLK